MGEKPILFSGPMVKAILEGRKTQTRRVVKLPSWSTQDWGDFDPDEPSVVCKDTGCMPDLPCPYGNPGDRLWVRETFYCDLGIYAYGGRLPKEPEREVMASLYYRADGECCEQIPECQCADVGKPKWRPSIFLPRYASRITLEITNVRVERLNEISEADATAEGVGSEDEVNRIDRDILPTARKLHLPYEEDRVWFAHLWDKINGKKYPWDSNPFVWVVEFRKV